MAKVKSIDREWIVAQFSKGIDAEQSLESHAESTAKSPPDPSLAVLYHQIAKEDKHHAEIIKIIAARYGHEPSPNKSGGLTGTLERIKGAVTEIGSTPQQRLEHDLTAKASAIHWTTAWVYAFEQIGDAPSAEELGVVLAEEKAHHDALQQGLNLLLAQGAKGQRAK